jgi:cysteinyl-tRNA synthetase
MSMRYLGETLDIHGGGQDLIFPHHENETAQSEACTGVPFVRFWVHNGLLNLGEEKMSKSLGNLVTIEEALRQYSPDALRLYFLGSHYRSPLAYSDEAIKSAERAAERLRNALKPWVSQATHSLDPDPYRQQFTAAMDDDLNTPRAIAALFDLAREINRASESGMQVAQAQETLRELGSVLGLTFTEHARKDTIAIDPYVQLLIEARATLRSQRLFKQADALREKLARLGVTLEDTPQGTVWKYSRSQMGPS